MEIRGNGIAQKVLENIHKVIIGKEETVRLLLTALLADGHVLLEDVQVRSRMVRARGRQNWRKHSPNLFMRTFPESSSPRIYCPPTSRD